MCTSRGQEIESQGYFRSQVIDGIGTQENIQCELRYVQNRGIVDGLTPFNPNQEDTNAINQIPSLDKLSSLRQESIIARPTIVIRQRLTTTLGLEV
ncbi:unnamed protein product [Trifolium pratense]|uniref:Uncharacterized protein n=1 Tax=Trifolium pratense TaxID=57577 RepID=A0ACB0ME88_TRIPR|nr:unnamed protein product [Trifolium pratense]